MPDPIDAAVGQRVKRRRKQLGLSQSDLGAHLSLTFQQIQKYENGANRISASMLVRIAERLGCSIASLFGEDEGRGIKDGQVFSCLAPPGSPDLVKAYAASAPRHRRLLLELAQSLAAPAAPPMEARPEDLGDL
jgi:transcriptional regulator with XRE-family HTH domain